MAARLSHTVRVTMTHAPGFYDDGHGNRRWWDGKQWTSYTEPAEVDPAVRAMQNGVLEAAVVDWTARGWEVASRGAHRVTVTRRIPMSVFWNIVGVVLTGGLWLIVVLVRLGSPAYERRVLSVDGNGVLTAGW